MIRTQIQPPFICDTEQDRIDNAGLFSQYAFCFVIESGKWYYYKNFTFYLLGSILNNTNTQPVNSFTDEIWLLQKAIFAGEYMGFGCFTNTNKIDLDNYELNIKTSNGIKKLPL